MYALRYWVNEYKVNWWLNLFIDLQDMRHFHLQLKTKSHDFLDLYGNEISAHLSIYWKVQMVHRWVEFSIADTLWNKYQLFMVFSKLKKTLELYKFGHHEYLNCPSINYGINVTFCKMWNSHATGSSFSMKISDDIPDDNRTYRWVCGQKMQHGCWTWG